MNELARPPGMDAELHSGQRADAAMDGRLVRGARSRRAVLGRAVDIASLEGLNGLSLGRLAADVGISKSGVQALFGTKEDLQIAVVEFARAAFTEAVIRPAFTSPAGATRLRALIELWVAYAEAPLFAGGCFWAANLADFDSRPGRIRDTLIQQQREWRRLLATELRTAADTGEIGERDYELAAFQIDAVLIAANTSLRLGDQQATSRVRRVVDGLLAPTG